MAETLASTNPATLQRIDEVEIVGEEGVRDAVGRARAAARKWGALTVRERAKVLRRVQDVIVERSAEIIDIVSRETGKPRVEALAGEVFISLYTTRFFAKHAKRILRTRRKRSALLKNKRFYLGYAPYGVVAVISPGNYPFYLSMVPIVPALIAGNVVICKPSEHTPCTGMKIGEIFRAAGLPSDVLQILPGDGCTGSALIEAGVNKVVFIGSAATGRKVAEAAGRRLVPVVLELGGKDAAIICRDAPRERAANAVVWGAFSNAGQVCASVERVYVVEEVAEPFIDLIVEKTLKLRQGIEGDCDIDVGPLISETQLALVERQVRDALEKGARLLTGGRRRGDLTGYFYEPTILSNVNHTMDVMRQETFGPVLPIMVVRDEREAVLLVNDSPYGLTASVWTRNKRKATELSARIHTGTVVINDCQSGASAPEVPWGGVKESGHGRCLSTAGLLEFVQTKVVSNDILELKRDPAWYPYSKKVYTVLERALPLLFCSTTGKALKRLLA